MTAVILTTPKWKAARDRHQKRAKRVRVKPDDNQELMTICRFLELISAAKPEQHLAIERAIVAAAVSYMDRAQLARSLTAARHLCRVLLQDARDYQRVSD